MEPRRRALPFIAPLQGTLVRRVLQVLAGVMVLWFGVYLGLNDRRLGKLVTNIVTGRPGKKNSGVVRGQFKLGYAHYDYWSSLASIILNTPAPVRGGDFEMIDPDGNLVMRVQEVHARMYIGELIRALIRTAFSAPFKRGVYVTLHFNSAQVAHGYGIIQPTRSSLALGEGRSEVNIIAAMSGKKPSTEPPGPGRLLITIDGAGLDFSDLGLEMNFPAWYARAEGLSGGALLRYSSAASENRPGQPGFAYDVRPLNGARGRVVLGPPADPRSFAADVQDVRLQRFGARASHPQSLSFRGKARSGAAQIELIGSLIDTYCDPGVDLEMSFSDAAALAERATSGLLQGGAPRGRIRIFGPFSDQPPRTPQGDPNPCLDTPRPQVPMAREGRAVIIEGGVEGVEGLLAGVRFTEGQSRLRLARGLLTLPAAGAAALGGQVRAEPLQVRFGKPLSWNAQVRVQGADPGQVAALPPDLRRVLEGRLNGTLRVTGSLAAGDKPGVDRVRFANLDLGLARQARRDPFPRDVELAGEVTYTPQAVTLRDISLAGEGLSADLQKGSVGLRSGRLDLEKVELRGGPGAGRLLQNLGLPATVREVEASLRVRGTMMRPEIEGGALAARDLTLFGRKLDEIALGLTLHDGSLALQGVRVAGLGGTATAQATLQLFAGSKLLRDPPLQLSARLDGISAAQLALPPPGVEVAGDLSAQVDLNGTVLRPTGVASLRAPRLLAAGADLRDLIMDLELRPEALLLNSLYAAVGARGLVNGSARLGRSGDLPLSLTLNPYRLALADIPVLRALPYRFGGDVSGSLRLSGPSRPLRPALDGELTLDGFSVSGLPLSPEERESASLSESQPLFRLLGMAVRSLVLGRATLSVREQPGGATAFFGTFFDTFQVSGVVHLDPLDLRGDVLVRFGCNGNQITAGPPGEANPSCDFAVEKLLPDLAQLADMQVRTSGELHVRFGRALQPPWSGLAVSPVQAELRLSRAAITVRTVDDDGNEEVYRVWNDGEVALASDGDNYAVERARFSSDRLKTGGSRPGLRTHGEVTLAGYLGRTQSDLHIAGQFGLELLEQLLRATFKRAVGTVTADLRLSGPRADLRPRGTIDLGNARLFPQDLDVPLHVRAGFLELYPQQARVRELAVEVDGVRTQVDGTVQVGSWVGLKTGALAFTFQGGLAGRLLQWALPRNLAEARGRIDLSGVRLGGTVDAPRLDGTLATRDLFLNIRKFHELHLRSGTVRLHAEPGGQARIVIGCDTEQRAVLPDCQDPAGRVDGDGAVSLSGHIALSGLGGLMKPAWYEALDEVRLAIGLSNVRHSNQGVYSAEVTTAAPLRLYGNRAGLTLTGTVAVVSGRYIQPFNLKDRIFTPRVVEEDEPFWKGDPFLSKLELDLHLATRGTVQIANNLAEVRLNTSDFTLTGPVSRLNTGGTVRVDSGSFFIPGMHGEFVVKGDSKLEFSPSAHWPETPWVDVRGTNVQIDRNDEQRTVELALRGKVSGLQIECISSDALNANDCASYLFLGGTTDQVRRSLGGDPYSSGRTGALADNAARMFLSQVLSQQIEDPLRQKLGLDTLRILPGVSSFDLQLCYRFGYYLHTCGTAELGLQQEGSKNYRVFMELQGSDALVGQVRYDHLEHSLEFLEETINRLKIQIGVRQALRF